jgi:hypothetical protein
MQAMEKTAHIDFTPCTGWGSKGRTATLRDADGVAIAYGHGETDHEAVLEALIGEGMPFDAAFDAHDDVYKTAAKHYTACEPNP